MKESTRELIKTECRKDTYEFLTQVIQHGRIRPAKYRHFIKMEYFLYDDLRSRGIVNPEDYYIDQSAFFEFRNNEVTISFMNNRECEDLHRRIDYYLVVKFAGSYPLKRGGISKL